MNQTSNSKLQTPGAQLRVLPRPQSGFITTAELFAQAPRLLAKAVARGWAKYSTDKSPVRLADKGVWTSESRRHLSLSRRRSLAAL